MKDRIPKLQPSSAPGPGLRLEVELAGGGRHVVRHPDHWCVQSRTGRVLLYPEDGPFEVQAEPGEIVGFRPL